VPAAARTGLLGQARGVPPPIAALILLATALLIVLLAALLLVLLPAALLTSAALLALLRLVAAAPALLAASLLLTLLALGEVLSPPLAGTVLADVVHSLAQLRGPLLASRVGAAPLACLRLLPAAPELLAASLLLTLLALGEVLSPPLAGTVLADVVHLLAELGGPLALASLVGAATLPGSLLTPGAALLGMPAALSTALLALVARELTLLVALLALRRVPAPTRTTLLAAALLGLPTTLLVVSALLAALLSPTASVLLILPTTLLVLLATLLMLLAALLVVVVLVAALLMLLAALLVLVAALVARELALLVALLALGGVPAAGGPALVAAPLVAPLIAALVSSALLSVALFASVLVLVVSCHSCGSTVAWVPNRHCKLNPGVDAVKPPVGRSLPWLRNPPLETRASLVRFMLANAYPGYSLPVRSGCGCRPRCEIERPGWSPHPLTTESVTRGGSCRGVARRIHPSRCVR
jgi:20S proteasome subunit beta 7